MQMVDKKATDFVNVQKIIVLFKTSAHLNSSDVKCYSSNYLMENALFYIILYTINKFNFYIDIYDSF